MIFFDKTKHTWLNAFRIKSNPLFQMYYDELRLYKKSQKALEVFKSDAYIRNVAYMLAERNRFLGESGFYWQIAIDRANSMFDELSAHQSVLEISIRNHRRKLRILHAY
jgi:hypothetical protein